MFETTRVHDIQDLRDFQDYSVIEIHFYLFFCYKNLDMMAACHLHVAAIRQSDSSAMWVDHSGVGCNGIVCRLPNSLPPIGETSCTYQMVPRLGGSQCLKQFVVPREDTRVQKRNTTRIFALKPPQQPMPAETEEAEVGIPEEGEKMC